MSDKRIGGRPKGQKTIVTSEQVYAVIFDRYTGNPPKPTNKKDVEACLSISWDIANDHFDRLHAKDRIMSVSPGYWIPTYVFQDRPVSLTTVPGARFKMEMGDHVVEFSPRELSDLVALGIGLVSR